MFVRPWNKESFYICKQLKINNGKAHSYNSKLPREFGQKYPELFDKGLLDVASTRYSRRKDKVLFQTPGDVNIFERGKNFHFKRMKIL